MPRLPALIDALTRHDDRPRAALEHVARMVRETGGMPTTRRGRGAAEMGVPEAANLVMGAFGYGAPGRAAFAAAHFRTLKPPPANGPPLASPFGYTAAPTFGEAIEALIHDAADIAHARHEIAQAGWPDSPPELIEFMGGDDSGLLQLHVGFITGPAAYIRLTENLGSGPRLRDERRYQVDARLLTEGFYGRLGSYPRTTTEIDLRTFLALHETIYGPAHLPSAASARQAVP